MVFRLLVLGLIVGALYWAYTRRSCLYICATQNDKIAAGVQLAQDVGLVG